MTVHRLQLTLTAALPEIERLHQAWQDLQDRHGLPEEARWKVQLAVEEIVTNTIVHGFKDCSGGSISMEVVLTPASICISLVDAAPAFDPLEAPVPDTSLPLGERQPGGLGVQLARTLMDHIEYARVDGKNHLIMEKAF